MDSRARAEALVAEGRAFESFCLRGAPGPSERAAYERAIEKYTEAIAACPEDPLAYLRRSVSNYFLGQHERARADAEAALARGFSDPGQYTFLAMTFEGERQREILRRGMSFADPDGFEYFRLWQQVANTYFYDGNFAAQLAELLTITSCIGRCTMPDLGGLVQLELGQARELTGDFAGAVQDYLAAAEASEQMRSLAIDLAIKARARSGDLASATALLEAHSASMSEREARSLRILLAALSGGPPAEPALLREIVSQDDGTASYDAFVAGTALMHAGHPSEALPFLEDFVEKCEGNPREWGVTLRWEIEIAKALIADALLKDPPSTK